ncbi:calcium-binding protein PBP1-like [Miscanthus floridulus]|uniref:calcium-binding protein PBP1-like n=1 Tax=Miscanthus floridulus TaxID=154761 RepID=UPI00345A7186
MISRDNSSMDSDKGASVQFQDFLPLMARKLGVEGLIQELCKGVQLLMEPRAGKITFRSLKQNAARLGLGQLRDDELLEMMKEGDLDGDGALDQMECILMVRLSPELMEEEAHRMFQH